MNSNETIQKFINNSSRNKLVFDTKGLLDIHYLNLGLELSKSLDPLLNDTKIGLIAKQKLDHLLGDSIYDADLSYPILAIENIGILFEKELKIDIVTLFDKHSQNNVLLVRWPGTIVKGVLCFLTKEKGITINIDHLSYTII